MGHPRDAFDGGCSTAVVSLFQTLQTFLKSDIAIVDATCDMTGDDLLLRDLHGGLLVLHGFDDLVNVRVVASNGVAEAHIPSLALVVCTKIGAINISHGCWRRCQPLMMEVGEERSEYRIG